MSMLVELIVLAVTFAGLMSGGCSIYWVRVWPDSQQAWWGRRLFVLTLLSLGGTAFFAALVHADGLAPLGLLSGFLTIAMLWEGAMPVLQDDTLR